MTDPRTDLSKTAACARCRRAPRDEDDLAAWELIEDDFVCPGCLTLLETDAHRREAP
jgi:hypothetical protein